MEELQIPEDLGLKIGTDDSVLWTKVLKETEISLKQLKEGLKIQDAIALLARQKIEEEKQKI